MGRVRCRAMVTGTVRQLTHPCHLPGSLTFTLSLLSYINHTVLTLPYAPFLASYINQIRHRLTFYRDFHLNPLPPHQVYVQTSDLGPGGVQPDFQTLASKVSGSMPKYLTVPTAFPSVNDMDEEDEEGEQEEVKLEMR